MQRSWVSNRDRVSAIGAVLLIHAGLAAALLTLGGGPAALIQNVAPLEVFDVDLVEPRAPPPPPPKPVEIEPDKAPEEEGASAPPARKAEATPIVRVEPKVELRPTQPVVTSETPGQGAAPSQGAAPVDGPGTGAGGQGTGTGSGSGGAGSGGGGSGGAAVRPSLASRPLTARDYSSASRRAWPSGRRVLVIFNVQLNGRATDCAVYQSIGVPNIDAETCALVTRKLRFRPARDAQGRPMVDKYAYAQVALF